MEKVDVTIIGAGIVGLACAQQIAEPGRQVLVIEKNAHFGMESSSRNSEVIHSGLYYPYQSLKHTLCMEGNQLIYSICAKKGIPYRKSGKYVVAANNAHEKDLHRLFANAKKNGIAGVSLVSGAQVRKNEPAVRCTSAMFVPSTGIVDSHQLMEYFLSDAQGKGAEVVFNVAVTGIEKAGGSGYYIWVKDADGQPFKFYSDRVVNSAGLDADDVAQMAGMDVDKESYALSYCKGSYFAASGLNISRPIYPVVEKDSVSLGIHVTPDLAARLRLGPDAEYLQSREKNYRVNQEKKESFFASVNRFLEGLDPSCLSADTAGIRPKLQKPGGPEKDFVIVDEKEKGLEGFINLIGIESPGLTASPAIAKMVKKLIA